MYLKKGVSLKGLQVPMVAALVMLSDAVGPEFVVTSGTEWSADRVPNSLHPKGFALDVRIPEPEDALQLDWKTLVQQAFTDTEFDLVWYETHVHIEFDPK